MLTAIMLLKQASLLEPLGRDSVGTIQMFAELRSSLQLPRP